MRPDVRTPEEYRHIPGSKNVPLQSIGDAAAVIKEKDAPMIADTTRNTAFIMAALQRA